MLPTAPSLSPPYFAKPTNTPSHPSSTPGAPLETRLNASYGPDSPFHKAVTSLIRQGIKNNEGWCATIPVNDNPKYRRSKIALPSELTRFFSITTVFMDPGEDDEGLGLKGQYHQHPYGEINCVITMEEGSKAELKGMNGWQGAGW